MLKNIAAAALTVLAIEFVVACRNPGAPAALGQAAASPSGQAILATVQSPDGKVYAVLYDVESKRLAWYTISAIGGIHILGARDCQYELRLTDLTNIQKRLSPKEIEALLK